MEQASFETSVTGAVFWKIAAGSDALTLKTSSSQRSSHISYRLRDATGISGTAAVGNSSNSNPPDHTPPDGIGDYLWLATRSGDNITVASAPPPSFSDMQTQGAGHGDGASTSTAIRPWNAASLDPGSFTSNTEQWVSFNLAIRGGGTATVRNNHTVTATTAVSVPDVTIETGGTVIINDGVTFTTPAGGSFQVAGTLQMGADGTATIAGAGAFSLHTGGTLGITSPAGITGSEATGNVQVTGPRTFSTDAGYVYNGIAPQQTGNGLPAVVAGLKMDNTDSGTGVSLTNSTTVTDTLNLKDGLLTTGANSITVPAAGSITNASAASYVSGNLCRGIPAGANTCVFPIGTPTAYAPATLDFLAGTEAGTLCSATTNGDHPAIATSQLDADSSVNRYWFFDVQNGLATANYHATFNWVSADADMDFDYSTALVGKYNAPDWTYPTPGARTATSVQITGASGFSAFQVGNEATISCSSITCAAGSPFVRMTDVGQCDYTVQGAEFDPTLGGDCPGATVSNDFNNLSTLAGADLPGGTTTIVWSVTAGMFSASCAIAVTVTDAEPPAISCPADISVDTDAGVCSAAVNFTTPAGTDNCPGATTAQTAGLTSGADFSVGTTTNTFETTAANGQTTACSFVVTVTDAEPPAVSCPADISVDTDPGACSAAVAYATPAGTDNCPGATTAQTAGFASGADFPVGTTTNTFETTAANGQTTSCSFAVTVTDAEPPAISCPADISVDTDPGACSAVVNFTTPSGTDNCPGATTAQTAGFASGETFPVGSTTNTFETTAANGQTTSCSFAVTVTDAEPPALVCPADISVETDAGACSAVVAYATPSGTDNCPGATTAQTAGFASGETFPVGSTTNTFETTAANGQTTACSFSVTVTDAEPPALVCPADISVDTDAGACSAAVAYATPSGTDNCPGATTAQTAGLASGSDFPVGTTTNTFETTAANGQTTSCSFAVTVTDAEPPAVSCPADISVDTDAGNCSAAVAYATPSGTDNCPGATTAQTAGLASGADFPVGTTANTFETTAANGQTTACSFAVTVTDTEPPAVSCPADISVDTDAGNCSAAVAYATPSGTDNCPGATTAQTAGLASGSDFPVGTTTNTFETTAANGQTTACSFAVTVTDAEPPAVSCPADISVDTDPGACSAAVNFTTPVGTDNCPGATTAQTAGLASGSDFPVGTTANTFETTAANGQTTACSFAVTVTDAEPPAISCPADISVDTDAGVCSAAVNFTTPSGTDNCPGATTAQTAGLASGSDFPVGSTTNTFETTAANGQTTSCSFAVTVTDAEPPAVSCPADISVDTDAGACSATVNFTTPVGTDNCPGATTAQTAGLASGSDFPVGTTANTFETTAANGQTTACSFAVTVTDAEPPAVSCPTDISVDTDAGVCSAAVIFATPSGTDNCPGATTAQTAGLASGSDFPVGSTTNTFETTAANGQTTACSFAVTVTDAEPPAVSCPTDISVDTDAGVCSAAVIFATPSGTDNCPGATTAQTAGLASGADFPVGTTTNTFETMAANGQTTSCSFAVTVTDAEPPAVSCPTDISVDTDAGVCSAAVIFATPSGTDNCPGATTAQTAGLASGADFPVGTTANTFETTAANGQTTACSFAVTVTDAEPPAVSCPTDISVDTDGGVCSAAVIFAPAARTTAPAQRLRKPQASPRARIFRWAPQPTPLKPWLPTARLRPARLR
ncbi:MAG: HYR domain-containing protein [Lewinellaceae bacterium]|nr:HYR domain-containing protein [Lewinellaceae bacterium]